MSPSATRSGEATQGPPADAPAHSPWRRTPSKRPVDMRGVGSCHPGTPCSPTLTPLSPLNPPPGHRIALSVSRSPSTWGLPEVGLYGISSLCVTRHCTLTWALSPLTAGSVMGRQYLLPKVICHFFKLKKKIVCIFNWEKVIKVYIYMWVCITETQQDSMQKSCISFFKRFLF